MRNIFSIYQRFEVIFNNLSEFYKETEESALTDLNKENYQLKIARVLQELDQLTNETNQYCKGKAIKPDRFVAKCLNEIVIALRSALGLISSKPTTPGQQEEFQSKIHLAIFLWEEKLTEYLDDWKSEIINHDLKVYFKRPGSQAAILISYRNIQGKSMHAAFYDHYTLRKITGHNTKTIVHPSGNTSSFQYFVTTTALFALGIDSQLGHRIIPEIAHVETEPGLLFIPGRAKDDKDVGRLDYEKLLITKARNRGQPILAICAGAWQLWEMYGGKVQPVEGHCYSRMPSILTGKETFGYMGNNVAIHRIALTPGTMVAHAMHSTGADIHPFVNSVHWLAADEKTLPYHLEISAVSMEDDKFTPRNRGGDMDVEAGTVEAFENKFGAPVMGIQWHPEAYYTRHPTLEEKRHLNILQYMAKAGDAYAAKKNMLREFEQKIPHGSNPLHFLRSLPKRTPEIKEKSAAAPIFSKK